MVQLYFLPKGWRLLLKLENPNKQDYQLYFSLHADLYSAKIREATVE